jgi:hypothetical protein
MRPVAHGKGWAWPRLSYGRRTGDVEKGCGVLFLIPFLQSLKLIFDALYSVT